MTMEGTRKQTLSDFISLINHERAKYYEIGIAIKEIREKRLYLEEEDNFDIFCRKHLGMARIQAHRYMAAARVVENLLPIGNIPLNESQARPLVNLTREEQILVFQYALDQAKIENRKVTTKDILAGILILGLKPEPKEAAKGALTLSLTMKEACENFYSALLKIRKTGFKTSPKRAILSQLRGFPPLYKGVKMSEEEFEILLFRKTMNLTSNQKSSARKYYKDAYKKSGVIPEGLRYRECRKASGRKPTYSLELVKRFIEIVQKASLAGIKDPDFITKELRTIENFRRRLKAEFGEIKPQTLYRLARKHQLKEYLLKPDGEEPKNLPACFEKLEVFDLIQMDGCNFHYFEIKNDRGQFNKPLAISFIDTGSRYIMAMDICFSESTLNSIKAFELFLSSTVFPQKEIRFRPDNSSGFVNLKRVLNELNHKYAAPERFFFKSNFAKAGKPKHKAHLESSHRLLHGFEDFIMLNIPKDKLVERIQGFRINTSGHKEAVTISRYDINLSELKATGIIEAYLKEHNETSRLFSVSGQMEKWHPREKFETYLKSRDSFRFLKRMMDAGIPLVMAGTPEITTLLKQNHEDVLARLRILNLTPLSILDFKDNYAQFEKDTLELISGFSFGNMWIFKEICEEGLEKLKEARLTKVTVNLVHQIIQKYQSLSL